MRGSRSEECRWRLQALLLLLQVVGGWRGVPRAGLVEGAATTRSVEGGRSMLLSVILGERIRLGALLLRRLLLRWRVVLGHRHYSRRLLLRLWLLRLQSDC